MKVIEHIRSITDYNIPQDCIYKQKGLKAMLDIKKVQKILENLQKNELINTNGELTDENSI